MPITIGLTIALFILLATIPMSIAFRPIQDEILRKRAERKAERKARKAAKHI